MNAEVLVAEPNRELSWTCYWLSPRLLAGEHRFLFEIQGPKKVLLHHGETFHGLLLPCLWPLMEQRTRQGLEAMNAALKERGEARHQD
ncbi:SRPBCC domain-containing protein [Verrucomicrobium sp. 3C]|uniref:SRPBCC domain-containing protein n=1 Tax=Verrucomicrobium sp. 3C TaxID=1134055 RepID=UPI00037B0544|nr:SRPBCC domain-containing protein [Verrucomicrobium sp. 3C]